MRCAPEGRATNAQGKRCRGGAHLHVVFLCNFPCRHDILMHCCNSIASLVGIVSKAAVSRLREGQRREFPQQREKTLAVQSALVALPITASVFSSNPQRSILLFAFDSDIDLHFLARPAADHDSTFNSRPIDIATIQLLPSRSRSISRARDRARAIDALNSRFAHHDPIECCTMKLCVGERYERLI